jgi:DNA invertase Pin-like site-specific DNA recombinase
MIKQIDAKTIQAMREMRRQRYAYATIAARFNCHQTTVRRYTKHIIQK